MAIYEKLEIRKLSSQQEQMRIRKKPSTQEEEQEQRKVAQDLANAHLVKRGFTCHICLITPQIP